MNRGSCISVIDFRGKTILFEKRPQKVVCLVESALTGIYMLRAEKVLYGISSNIYEENFFRYYSQLDERIKRKNLPASGNWDFVNIEQIVSLEPDLVIIWSSQSEAIKRLEDLGIKVYAVFLDNFDDIYKEVKDFGILFDKDARADSLIRLTKMKLDSLKIKFSVVNKPKVYFMWSQGMLHTSGKNSTVSELLAFAGTKNACDIEEEHVNLNIEKIYEWDPEMIVMWQNEKLDPEEFKDNAMFSGLRAVKNKKVYELPEIFTCDFWTLKMVYPVFLIGSWSSGHSFEKQDSIFLNKMFYDLYGKELL
ncbi:MAG: ABC transporter substrate-binding protein [Saprospiraceae bacterium]|nr:ABC transporter substrate-binding protein [Saprospiraceae bacterium]